MILDTSAIIAVVFREPGFEVVLEKIANAKGIGVGAPSLAESGIVLQARLANDARGILARMLQEWQVEIVPFSDEHWREALEAYSRFGRGRHRAALNFGDCLSYAVAKLAGQPLLCVGKDFPQTDIELA